MSCYTRGGSTRHSEKSRNLSEKKRRDQFNMLVNELGSMVCTNTRKTDKSTILKLTISFLKNHNEIAVRSRAHEIQEDWKPSFLSNEEFTHLILEALDGFIIVFSANGRIYYASQSVTPLLGYLPSDLAGTSIYEIAFQEDQTLLYNVLANPSEVQGRRNPNETNRDNRVSFTCHLRIGGLDFQEEAVYELVQFVGYFRADVDVEPDIDNLIPNERQDRGSIDDSKLVFVGTGRLQTPQLIREMGIMDNVKFEFTSRHSLEWKFLFLDHRAPPIIGYLPIEVLGTSGYDYYHADDLDKVVACHEALMQKGEGTSCHYRFLTKGQQWIWLQTRFYITYNQWNSKPEFVVCTHRVFSYADVIKQLRKNPEEFYKCQDVDAAKSPSNSQQRRVATSSQSGLALSPWSSRSSKTSRSVAVTPRPRCHGGPGSDTTSISTESQSSKHSHQALQNVRSKVDAVTVAGTASTRVKPQQPDAIQPCVGFLEPSQYVAAIPVQPIITATFTAPAAPAVISTLQTPEAPHQQNIVMTPAQNHMQDELERKHDELQQLIFHYQEELGRVSEELFFTKYGVFSPLLNIGMPYTSSSCPQTVRCVSSTTSSVSRPMSSPGVQGVSVLPVPITLSVPVVSSELFAHPLAVSPLPMPTAGAASEYNVTNSSANQEQHQHQHEQQHHQQQHSVGQPVPPDPAQAGPQSSELLTFHVCQQDELIFSQISSSGSNG